MTFENQPAGGAAGQPSTSGLAIAALIVGVVSLLFAVFIFPLGLIGGVIGAILGFIARGKIRRGEAGGNGIALGGIVTSLLAIAIAIFVGVILVQFFERIADCADPDLTQEELEQCLEDRIAS